MKKIITLLIVGITFLGCSPEEPENVKYVPPKATKVENTNDIFLRENMFEPYGTSVRWRWDNRFIPAYEKATPIKAELVIPVTKLIKYLWIGIYESQGEKGKSFISSIYPPELQYIGSYIYQNDGSVKLGYAESGARITLLNLNGYNLQNEDWLNKPGGGILSTIHHEFSHIVHQTYGMPLGFNEISETYLGGGWVNTSNQEALELGMVRNYATKDEYEDFCEIVSHFLTLSEDVFNERFINQDDCSALVDASDIEKCTKINQGKQKIAKKLRIVIDYYQDNFGINLVSMRDELQRRIKYVMTHNKTP